MGAPGSDSQRGFARFFVWDSLQWLEGPMILDQNPGDLLGAQGTMDVSADGTTIALGAPGYDAGGSNMGLVQVWMAGDTGWVLKGTPIAGEASEDSCGIVAIIYEGNILAVGSPGHNENGSKDVGQVRIFS